MLARPRAGELIFAELKREKGRVSVMQKVWLRTLAAAGAAAYLWYPSDMPEIVARLSAVG